MSSLVFLTEEGEIKKVEKTSSIILTTFLLIVMALAIIGLIYYGATAAYWGTVVDKYTVEEKTVVEYDETLNAEVTITYPTRYVVVVKCEDAYYKFETNRNSYENMHIGSFTSTGTKAGAERVEKNE